jgi:GNAT superfamily N-acetyltransferase
MIVEAWPGQPESREVGGAPARRVSLRRARHADRAEIVALQRLSLRTLGRGHYGDREIESYLRHTETLEEYLVDDGTYYVAVVDGRIVGCGGWSLKPPAYSAVTHDPAGAGSRAAPKVRAMYVHPAHARRGIGRRLLARIERAILAAGHGEAALDATLPGVALYVRCGYRAVGETCATLPDGERLRFVCMRKQLAPVAGGPPR